VMCEKGEGPWRSKAHFAR